MWLVSDVQFTCHILYIMPNVSCAICHVSCPTYHVPYIIVQKQYMYVASNKRPHKQVIATALVARGRYISAILYIYIYIYIYNYISAIEVGLNSTKRQGWIHKYIYIYIYTYIIVIYYIIAYI